MLSFLAKLPSSFCPKSDQLKGEGGGGLSKPQDVTQALPPSHLLNEC